MKRKFCLRKIILTCLLCGKSLNHSSSNNNNNNNNISNKSIKTCFITQYKKIRKVCRNV